VGWWSSQVQVGTINGVSDQWGDMGGSQSLGFVGGSMGWEVSWSIMMVPCWSSSISQWGVVPGMGSISDWSSSVVSWGPVSVVIPNTVPLSVISVIVSSVPVVVV
jgi:hypothetical protein